MIGGANGPPMNVVPSSSFSGRSSITAKLALVKFISEIMRIDQSQLSSRIIVKFLGIIYLYIIGRTS